MSKYFRCLFLLILLLTSTALAQHRDRILTVVQKDVPYLDALYKHLHANPELSFHEKETSKRIALELSEAGFRVTENVGGYGVVGVRENGSGPTLMIRTDLDALPVQENTGKSYASRVTTKDDAGNDVSVMHACGHDVHMTCFIGTARALEQMTGHWRGTLVMIGQPAEERGAGARAMLADGLFERFPRPEYALALHVNATIAAGRIGLIEGYALANVDMVDITVFGAGGHGAYPQATKDPIVLAAQIVLGLQTIVSREIKPGEPAVVTVGSIHGGTKHNIIPDEVTLQLTLRSYSDEVRQQTIAAIRRIAEGQAAAAGVGPNRMPKITFRDAYTPATYNDPELTNRIAGAISRVLGQKNVFNTQPVMGGEDFGLYGRQEPKTQISMFWLGTVDPAKVAASGPERKGLPSLHSSLFAPEPDPTIKNGVAAMTAAALHLLGK